MRVAYQSGAMIPTAGESHGRRRRGRWLPSGLVLAFLLSAVLHAVALGWGRPLESGAGSADRAGTELAVRLVERFEPVPRPLRKVEKPVAAVRAGQAGEAPARLEEVLAQPLAEVATETAIAPPAAPVVDLSAEAPPTLAALGQGQALETDPAVAGLPSYREQVLRAAQRLQRYPRRARFLGVEGTVVVSLEPGADPRVELADSSGSAILDRAALELIARAARDVSAAEAPRGTLRFPVRYDLLDQKR